MRLPNRPFRIPALTQGVIEGMDASVAPVGSLAAAVNFVPTPADRLAVRGGSSVVQTLHDDSSPTPLELADVLRLDPFTPVGMVAIGWSSAKSKHYAYRLTPDAAFFTGTESTSRTDLTASPSTGWNVGPRRPTMVELFSTLFIVDGTATFSDRQPMVVLDGAGTLTMPLYALSGAIAATATLMSNGTNPDAGDTVTLGAVTYTFRTSVGTTANEVLIGATPLVTLTNLCYAVAAEPTQAAVTFGSATVANPAVTGAVATALTAVFTAILAGTAGNSLASTETSAHLSFGGTTFSGGSGSNPAPLQPLCAEEYNNVLFIAGYGDEGAKDVPNLVRHSFLGQPPGNPVTGFDPLAYNHFGADGVPVLALKKGRGILLVFKANEIWRVTGFGNAYPGWQYQVELVNNTFGYGVSNPWAVTFAEDYWYGWGANGPFRTDGYTVQSLRGPREMSWRLLNQFTDYWVEYHPDRRLVLFGVHPAQTSGDRSATYPWYVWAWDLARSVWASDWVFGQSSHSPDFGAGFDLAHIKAINTTTVSGPSAPPAIEPVTGVGLNGFTANWDNGDTSASTEVWVSQAAGPFTLFATAAPGAISQAVTGWVEGNAYTVKVRHIKAGVTTAYSVTTGWAPSPYPAPNPPTAIAITGVTYLNADVERNPTPPPDSLVTANATVSFTIPVDVDDTTLYMDGISQHDFGAQTGGTVITDFVFNSNIGGPPADHTMHFVVTRKHYTLIQTPDVVVTS